MPIIDFLLCLLVVTIWGINFIFLKLGVDQVPPLLLSAIRFILASIPAVFFMRPPAVPFRWVFWYGIIMFDLQFGLVFLGLKVGMTSGMAALLMQVQIFLSMFMAAIALGEVPFLWQILGGLISFGGIGVVAMHLDQSVTLAGFLCIIAAAAAWGFGNLITKKMGKINMMSLVVWSCVVASVPMIVLSLLFEGPRAILSVYDHVTWVGWFSIFYMTYLAIWVGYGLWNWLVGRYPVGKVVPFTLLIPVIGMASSALILGEPMQPWKWLAAILVVCGLIVNLFGGSVYQLLRKRSG